MHGAKEAVDLQNRFESAFETGAKRIVRALPILKRGATSCLAALASAKMRGNRASQTPRRTTSKTPGQKHSPASGACPAHSGKSRRACGRERALFPRHRIGRELPFAASFDRPARCSGMHVGRAFRADRAAQMSPGKPAFDWRRNLWRSVLQQTRFNLALLFA